MSSARPERASTRKTPVGAPHDPAERQADRLADWLTRPTPQAPLTCTICASSDAPSPAVTTGGSTASATARPDEDTR